MIGASGDHANVLAELVGFGFFKGLCGEGERAAAEGGCRSISWVVEAGYDDGGGGWGKCRWLPASSVCGLRTVRTSLRTADRFLRTHCGHCGQNCGHRADTVRTADTIFLWLEGTWYLKIRYLRM
jgi:hypothetical protein